MIIIYQYCQLNHLNNKSELFQNEKISSDNSQVEKRKKSFQYTQLIINII